MEGIIKTTGSFYSICKFKPCKTSGEILSRFDENRTRFLSTLFRRAKKGKTWFTIDLNSAAREMGEQRERLPAALNYLEEQGDLILKASGLRHSYRVLDLPDDVKILAEKLAERFLEAERRDIRRIKDILDLSCNKGCILPPGIACWEKRK